MARNITDVQMKLLGKIANVEQDKKLAYLDGIKDYIQIVDISLSSVKNAEFISVLYNYICEHKNDKNVLIDFCSFWKNLKE